ncbi:hypothetical protein DN748_10880 [Sinomicrobium soli]|nr:hypothetical protein DN748_10880 [Sinomicrobium sp. N-1-3-6]
MFNSFYEKIHRIEKRMNSVSGRRAKQFVVIWIISALILLGYSVFNLDFMSVWLRTIVLLVLLLFVFSYFIILGYKQYKRKHAKEAVNLPDTSDTTLNINQTEILINFLKKWFSSPKGSDALENDLKNLLELNLANIEDGGLISEANKKIDIGRILFQIAHIGIWDEEDIKKIYSKSIISHNRSINAFKDNTFNDHKNSLKEKKKLYTKDSIDIPKILSIERPPL